jgi:hypothetical protein
MSAEKLIDVHKVAWLSYGTVMVAIGEFLPGYCIRPT